MHEINPAPTSFLIAQVHQEMRRVERRKKAPSGYCRMQMQSKIQTKKTGLFQQTLQYRVVVCVPRTGNEKFISDAVPFAPSKAVL